MAQAPAADSPFPQPPLEGRVTRVNDGDSLEVSLASGAARVRLSAVDTPEHDQPYGAQASVALKAMLPLGSAVELEVVTQDQFRRIVAIVWLVEAANRININERMLREGHAWAYRRYLPDAQYCDIEAEAREARRGLWAQELAHWVYPPEWRYLNNGEIRSLPAPYAETRETCLAVFELRGSATYTPGRG
jgi:endonuclease YncB( thermonuclease family)